MRQSTRTNAYVLLFFGFCYLLLLAYYNAVWLAEAGGAKAVAASLAAHGWPFSIPDHLGGEYYHVARALYEGHGFSSPFSHSSAATAWIPPALPTLYACVLFVTGGSKVALIILVLVGHAVALAVTSLLVYLTLAKHVSPKTAFITATGALTIALVPDARWFFQVTHDNPFVLVWVDILLFAQLRWECGPRTKRGWAAWSCIGAGAALSSPIVGLLWGLSTLFVWGRHARRASVVCVALAIALTTPWTIRNYLEFGAFVPVKSNGWYETYQAQVLTRDGLVDWPSFLAHPYHAGGEEEFEFTKQGEHAYMAAKKSAFFASVRADPRDYVRRIANRLLAATLWYYDENREQGRAFHIRRALYLVHFCFLLWVIVGGAWRERRELRVALLLYAVYLFPYVLVSYYGRYGAALLPVKALIIAFGALDWRRSINRRNVTPATRVPTRTN